MKPECVLKEKCVLILKKIKNHVGNMSKQKNMKQNNLFGIKDPEGIVHYDDIGKANLLNEYFTSVFTVDTDFEECATLENGIGSIYFTTQDILGSRTNTPRTITPVPNTYLLCNMFINIKIHFFNKCTLIFQYLIPFLSGGYMSGRYLSGGYLSGRLFVRAVFVLIPIS